MVEKCVLLIVCLMNLVLRSLCSDECQWSSWGDCSATCGLDGTRRRTRPSHCFGLALAEETDFCGIRSCSAECDWSSWGECSVTCGKGSRTKKRPASCATQGRAYIYTEDCINVACTGVWSPWSSWTDSPCSATCGVGTQKYTRERHCSNEGECTGDHSEQKQLDCKNLQPCQGECSWSSSGMCNVTCCVAPQRRLTNCNVTDQTTNVETRSCTYGACSGAWAPWSPWINGTCSVTCGDGKHTSTRIRHCLITGPCTGVGMEHKQLDCTNLPDCSLEVVDD